MYLTNYHYSQLPQILKKVAEIAKRTAPITFRTKTIATSPSMYTMLFVISNKSLQQLADEIVISLMTLRDKQAKIPAWVQDDRNKKTSFLNFGSPNVFKNFSPHFSLFAADHLTKREATNLHAALISLLSEFNKPQTLDVKAQAIAIGIGLANEQGQIVKELHSFPLG